LKMSMNLFWFRKAFYKEPWGAGKWHAAHTNILGVLPKGQMTICCF